MNSDAGRLARLCEALATPVAVRERLASVAEELAQDTGITGVRIETGAATVSHGTVGQPWHDVPIPGEEPAGTLRVAGADLHDADLAFLSDVANMISLMLRSCAEPAEQTHARMINIIRHMADILVVMAEDGSWEIPYAAGHVERFGILPASPDPEALFLRMHPDDVPAARRYLDAVLHLRPTGPSPHVRLHRRDGAWQTMEMIGHNVLGDPLVHGIVLHLRDITDLVRAQRALERDDARLTTIFESMDGAVLLEDGQRRIKVVNQNMIDLFEMPGTKESLIGADCTEAAQRAMHLFRDPEGFVASVGAALAEKRPRLDEEFTMADGRTLGRDYIPVWFDDEYLGHLWVYWDISALKRAEFRLREQNRTLSELADMKTQFVASVSHELRTPLASITGFTDLLLEGEDPLTDEQREFLQAVDRNAHRLLALVSDLLMAARLESRRLPMDFTRIDVADLARTAVHEQDSAAKQREVTLHADIPDVLLVRGDGTRLTQVLTNLLGNAIKFSREGGTVDVTLRKVDSGHWQMIVRDSGVGIPEKEVPKLFRSFFRASNVRSSTTGTGLGLVICKAIVERHGGDIEVASEEGTGTTMTVNLPVRPPKQEPPVDSGMGGSFKPSGTAPQGRPADPDGAARAAGPSGLVDVLGSKPPPGAPAHEPSGTGPRTQEPPAQAGEAEVYT